MEKLDSLEEYKWIRDETVYFLTDKREGSRVENFLPKRFTHYCKIIHPLFRDPQIKDESLLWRDCTPEQASEFQLGERLRLMELAEKYDLKFSKELSAASLMKKLGGSPRYIISGEEGEIESDSLKALVGVLRRFTDEGHCYFLYGLLKSANYVDELYRGDLAEVEELAKRDHLYGTPSYWWPADKSWCLYTDIDLNFSLIGGSPELIEALLADDFLECIECDASTRIDNLADYTNNE
ncbi:hypothetical protein [Planomicrobium sp. MB-3u-38]|uniref:hypothetical protein n=1 Tax=Planomicrobium sp. MB-3u-38 TaxID=2058318 RepID=UPI000C79AEB6|nr:hypothetical protein [Planomicrobium sp. MB-3u-38]PKH08535.1 hypothetical protein CXF70_16645 [Planomicrobium sp. MB-3u-38]